MTTQDIDRDLSILIGGRLRTARALKGISQGRLADALGITFQQVQKYESGKNRISAPVLIRAARYLDQPLDFFIDGENSPVSGLEGLDVRDVALIRRMGTLPHHITEAMAQLIEAIEARPA